MRSLIGPSNCCAISWIGLRPINSSPCGGILSELYRHRGDVEVDIRNLKVVLNTERIEARSVEMFRKELLTSLVAYNLVTQFRRQAAALIAEPHAA